MTGRASSDSESFSGLSSLPYLQKPAGGSQGFLVAATSSSSGKTLTAISLIAALKKRGHDVLPFKAGPDYIDAGWLERAAGRPCANLDIWMSCSPGALIRFYRHALEQMQSADPLVVVEGAMGLYDGDATGGSSSAELAALLKLPVLLLVNAKGMGHSCAAIARGFLAHNQALPNPVRFCGIVCTHTGSPRHERILRSALEPVCGIFDVPLLGMLPAATAPVIPARHLGLRQAHETVLDLDYCARWLEANCDVPELVRQCVSGTPKPAHGSHINSASSAVTKSVQKPVIAIARDDAFSFCYPDLPWLLEDLGACIKYFSPLKDSAPPRCSGIYLPGGYPELFAGELGANGNMRDALASLALSGMPIHGECGGYIYLMKSLTDIDGGVTWPMAGLLPLECRMGSKLAALGYRMGIMENGDMARGHEFHYARIANILTLPFTRLWKLKDSEGRELGAEGCVCGSVSGSWVHLYPAGSKNFWQRWFLSIQTFAAGIRQ